MDINITPTLDFHSFGGAGINDYVAGMVNVVLHLNSSGEVEPTQRPSIDVVEDSTAISGLTNRGRGIYYWEQTQKLYIVHDDSLYETTQDSTRIPEVTGTFGGGTERCMMLETIGNPQLVILDAENNQGFVLTTALALDLIGSNFPSSLVHGGAILDGYLFVMDEEGIIYNSAIDDPTIFPALGFVEAERENDKGVYLGKHRDHIVAFGTRTIEFFYDAGNSTGSPLNRRQDISYNIGCASGLSVWESGDITYFIGSQSTGELSVYKLESFNVSVISTNSINSYLTQGIIFNSLKAVLSGVSAMGNNTLLLTIYIITSDTINPQLTLSYDTVTNKWGFWNTKVHGLVGMPIMASTKRTGGHNAVVSARPGESILYNGDIININDKLVPVDTILGAGGIYESGIYDVGIYSESAGEIGDNIEMSIRTGLVDGDIRNCKFLLSENVLMEPTDNPQTLTIKHSRESTNDFDSGRTIDTSLIRKEIYQGGMFNKINTDLSYAGDEQIFLEKYQMEIEAGL